MIKGLIKYISILLLMLTLGNSTAFADINDEMQAMMDQVLTPPGGPYNINSPGAFRTQSSYGVFGGSASMRFPNKTYQITQTSLPSIKAGCGGIDIFLGSFSLISLDKIVELLKNIMTNAAGLIFQLAIDTISPMIGSDIKTFLSELMKYGNFAIGSCEAAQHMVGGIRSGTQSFRKQACKDARRAQGDDENISNAECGGDNAEDRANEAQEGKPGLPPEDVFVYGNVIWRALNKVSADISLNEKELMMGLIGTVIITRGGTPPGGGAKVASTIVPMAPLIPDAAAIKQLMFGLENPDGTGKVPLKVYVCKAGESMDPKNGCLTLETLDVKIEPYATRVAKIMKGISVKIQDRSVPPNANELAFINLTGSVPVWKILAVANTVKKDEGLDDAMIDRYKELVAVDYAETYLAKTLHAAHSIMSGSPGASALEEKAIEKLIGKAREILQVIRKEKERVMASQNSVRDITDEVTDMERKLYGNLPHQLQATLKYSAGGSTK